MLFLATDYGLLQAETRMDYYIHLCVMVFGYLM
jgi:hypothetical protein